MKTLVKQSIFSRGQIAHAKQTMTLTNRTIEKRNGMDKLGAWFVLAHAGFTDKQIDNMGKRVVKH